MEKFLEKLHQRPKKQRVMIFFAATAVSIMTVGYFWVRSLANIDGNISVYNKPTKDMAANSYTQKIDLPDIKKYFSDILAAGKQVYAETSDRAKKFYIQYKEAGSAATNNNGSLTGIPKDPSEVPVKEILGGQPAAPQQ